MIKEHNQATLKDVQGNNDLVVEMNWNPKDPLTNEAKILRVKLPGSKHSYIKRDELHRLMLIIGTRPQKSQLIPELIRRSRWYETKLGVEASKDIRKGDMIIFDVKIPLPDEREVVWGRTERLPNNVTKRLPEGLVVPKTGFIPI